MSPSAIPAWSPEGFLPPVNPLAPTSADRSPYRVTLTDFILHFNTSPNRNEILSGLLAFRAALHAIGLVSGFQWVDGSFLEHVEVTERRSPNDLDVVTFFEMPSGDDQASLFSKDPNVFNNGLVKTTHKLDSYFVEISTSDAIGLIEQTSYWYSLWSHRRDQRWKGFVQIALDPSEDPAAVANLTLAPAAPWVQP